MLFNCSLKATELTVTFGHFHFLPDTRRLLKLIFNLRCFDWALVTTLENKTESPKFLDW